MRLKRAFPLSEIAGDRETAGYWRTLDERFSILRTHTWTEEGPGRRERSWIIQPRTGNEAESPQTQADRALLKSLGLLQTRFKTRREAAAALELALAESG